MTVGKLIRERRRRAGLSQEALGEKAGVSQNAITHWEQDKKLPWISSLKYVSQVLEISPEAAAAAYGESVKKLLND